MDPSSSTHTKARFPYGTTSQSQLKWPWKIDWFWRLFQPPPNQEKEVRKDGSVRPHGTVSPRSNNGHVGTFESPTFGKDVSSSEDNNFNTWLNRNFSHGQLMEVFIVPSTQGTKKDACIVTTRPTGISDESNILSRYADGRDDSDIRFSHPERPIGIPAKTKKWKVSPKEGFYRGVSQDKDCITLCDQCSQIDFQAIFRPDGRSIMRYGSRVCSFSGLSRNMLESDCPSCKVIATTVYAKFPKKDEVTLLGRKRKKHTFEGCLLATSSGEQSGDFRKESIVIRTQLLMPPFPSARSIPWDCFNWRPNMTKNKTLWRYARARGLITPSLMADNVFGTLDGLHEQVDCCYISRMIDQCHHKHPHCCINDEIGFPQDAKVVDCHTRQVVTMKEGTKYIALSYVWGERIDTDIFRKPANIETLDFLPQALPQLIKDALRVTENLGYQYLWIDVFCINQQHKKEKATQIRQMANINHHAAATICALEAHPDVGLPGISRPRPVSKSFRSQDVTYFHCTEPDFFRNTLRRSTWMGRGWTFQEAILSRRCIFFTEDGVSLLCHSSHQTETVPRLASHQISGLTLNLTIFKAVTGDKRPCFRSFVNQYQKRQLSYDTDALDAFKGLLSLAPTQSYFGILLPVGSVHYTNTCLAFVYGLLWLVEDPKKQPVQYREGFPSWSWVRTKGAINSSFIGRNHIAMKSDEHQLQELRCRRQSQKALSMQMSCAKEPWIPTIRTKTPAGKWMSIKQLFQRYNYLRVVPEQSKILRIRSFIATYRVSDIHFYPGLRRGGSADVEMQNSAKLPIEFPDLKDAGQMRWFSDYGPFSKDKALSKEEQGKNQHQAILLLYENTESSYSSSYWMTLNLPTPTSSIPKSSYKEDGGRFFYREGIIKVSGKLKWKEGWQNAPRDEIWLG
ncbi:HET-domain-containing protein [Massarina eburnea CBS 473.64]|uniref:HET-domain-containing protein n=1 Tax=Massarina eburnea CBS 473.64 TaxID=1395130 RepID=A0A6A6RJU5_9PLEO|nr:HET-domain-containing protein [Massarina eburnea CBS 473.64]